MMTSVHAAGSSWPAVPLKYLLTRHSRKGHGHRPLLSVYRDHGVVPKDSRTDNHNKAGQDLENYLYVEPGDLVINTMKAWQGSVSVSDFEGIVSPAYSVFGIDAQIHGRFLHHQLRSSAFVATLKRLSAGVRPNQWDLDISAFGRCAVSLPPLSEQMAIARFIDERTQSIDALIEKKERFMEVLAEKRRAFIQKTVTQGLNPEVPLKDTGIPWIGSIPEHWTVLPVRWAASRIKNGATPPTGERRFFQDGTVPWFAPASLSSDSLTLGAPKGVLHPSAIHEGRAPKFAADSVLVVGIGGSLGRVAHLEMDATANQQVMALEFPQTLFDARFVAYQFKYREHVFRHQALFTTLPIMNQFDLGGHMVIRPPLDEQVAIRETLDEALERFRCLSTRHRTHIEELKAYRQALIDGAVSGDLAVVGG